jgi:hypothetical protein
MVEVNNVMTFLGYGLMDGFARSSKDMMSFNEMHRSGNAVTGLLAASTHRPLMLVMLLKR